MATRTLLSSEQRTRLFSIPTDLPEMARHYTLSLNDLDFINPRRPAANRFGCAVLLCLLRYPGFSLGQRLQPPEAKSEAPHVLGGLLHHVHQTDLRIAEHYNDLLAHVAPLGWEHIALTGDYVWNPVHTSLRCLRNVRNPFTPRAA